MIPLIGAAISGGLNYLGAREANAQNAANAMMNIAGQVNFAKNAIQWKVQDAQKAGIHPLFALGASTSGYQPVSVGAQNTMSGFSGLADALKDGQDTSRAASATATAPAKQAAQAMTRNAVINSNLDTGEKALRLELLQLQVDRLKQQSQPPAPSFSNPLSVEFPGAGGNTTHINPEPMKVVPGAKMQPQSEAGSITDVGYARTSTGWAPVPSKDVKERIEDQIVPEAAWALRNYVMPSFGSNLSPPPFAPPPGQKWHYNYLRQEYQLTPDLNVSPWSALYRRLQGGSVSDRRPRPRGYY